MKEDMKMKIETRRGHMKKETGRGHMMIETRRGHLMIETRRGHMRTETRRGHRRTETRKGHMKIKTRRGHMKIETRRGHKNIETRRGPQVEVHIAEDTKKTEGQVAEIDLTAQEDLIDTEMIERIAEEGQKRLTDMQIEEMIIMTEEEMMTRKGQEAQLPEEGNIEKIALNTNMKVGEEEAEEATLQKQEIEEETPATINEGGAQGP